MDQQTQNQDRSGQTAVAPTRRDFITLAAAFACAAALCPAAEVLAGVATGPVDLGTPADFAQDGFVDKWAASDGFFIVRKNGELYALSARCTHKGGSLKIDAANANELKCPKHGAHFGLDGAVEKGPAKKSLGRFEITKNDKGHVTVDPSKSVDAGAAGGSIKI